MSRDISRVKWTFHDYIEKSDREIRKRLFAPCIHSTFDLHFIKPTLLDIGLGTQRQTGPDSFLHKTQCLVFLVFVQFWFL